MTEVMVRSSVGESFSFADGEFEKNETKKESEKINNDAEDESTVSFNEKLDISCEKSSESTICESLTDESVVSDSHTVKTELTDTAQDSANSTTRSDFSSDEYIIPETSAGTSTYIAESSPSTSTYKMVSETQSDNYNVETVSAENEQISIPESLRDTVDKSKVIVQILSSDSKDGFKSQNVIKCKIQRENQNTHSFRDDVFKILSKSQPSMNAKRNINEDPERVSLNNQTFPSRIEKTLQIVRAKRKHGYNPFLIDRGPKLCEIKHVSLCLRTATIGALRILHYVLYDKYGLCGSELQIAQTRRKILYFSGYPFDEKSFSYQKRLNSLLKIPVEMLREVHEAIFGKTIGLERGKMVTNLMSFFLDTEKYDEIVSQMKPSVKSIPENEYTAIKKRAMTGPLPVVVVKRLKSEDVNKLKDEFEELDDKDQKIPVAKDQKILDAKDEKTSEVKKTTVNHKTAADESYALPAYILKGPGRKLKRFPAVVRNVENAKEKDLNLLHYLLYGRIESLNECRRNILEFSGFLECQNEFINEVQDILRRLDRSDMLELCSILCLRAKTNSRNIKIKKIMQYLKSPYNPVKVVHTKDGKIKNHCRKEGKVFPKRSLHKLDLSRRKMRTVHPVETWDEPPDMGDDERGCRLRDFKKICANIECSAPADLSELNDLLFMKPSDETDIHDKILNFTRFSFSDTSVHYHYRKTLMFYMGPCIVRKIAKLLDIENWHLISSHEDLSACVLNFLMERKFPGSSHSLPFSRPEIQNEIDGTSTSKNDSPTEVPNMCRDLVVANRHEDMVISTASHSSINPAHWDSNDHMYLNVDCEKRNDSFSSGTSVAEDDSVPLRDFIHHPTDQELRLNIDAIVKSGLFAITLGDVVKKVYELYPYFNLTYRENFIKSEVRKVVSELRQEAVDRMKQSSSL